LPPAAIPRTLATVGANVDQDGWDTAGFSSSGPYADRPIPLLAAQDYETLLATIEALHACPSLEEFPALVSREVARLVEGNLVGYNEVRLREGTLVVSYSPAPPADANRIGESFERYMGQHPLVDYTNRTGDGQALMISDFQTAEEFHAGELYRTVYHPLRAEDQIAICIRPEEDVVIGIACNRPARTFTERDRKVLNLLRPHLVQAYVNLRRVHAQREDLEALRETLDAIGHGVITTNSAGTIIYSTPGAFDLIARFAATPLEKPPRLPHEMTAWLGSPEPLCIPRHGRQLSVRCVPRTDGFILICSEKPDQALAGYSLTPRETEVLRWIAEGKTNAEIASVLAISPATVKVHVEHLLEKLRVENRTAAALLAHEHGLRGNAGEL
jgi:DNA-binding CsgD family transcriptional regulator/PAS domain-containing protein